MVRTNKIKDEETLSYLDEKGNEVFFKKFLDPEFEPIIEVPEDPFERLERIRSKSKNPSLVKKSVPPRNEFEDIKIDILYKENDMFTMQIEKVNNFMGGESEDILHSPERKHVKFKMKDKNMSESEFIETDEDIENAIESCLDLFGTNLILPKHTKEKNSHAQSPSKTGFLYL